MPIKLRDQFSQLNSLHAVRNQKTFLDYYIFIPSNYKRSLFDILIANHGTILLQHITRCRRLLWHTEFNLVLN